MKLSRLLLGAALCALLLPSAAAAAQTNVYAAASLRGAFPKIDRSPRYNFAGSNQLQTQIENGAPADVFAAASPKEAQALYRAGRCSRPVTFATNRVVLLVPRANRAKIRSIRDLTRGSRKRLAIAAPAVPIGAYTRTLLRRARLSSILRRNTVSNETNVANVTSKVALGSADAGFAYRTDATVVGRRVRVINLPRRFQPPVRYQICAVARRGANTRAARAFIRKVRSTDGRRALRRAAFGLPPRARR